MTCAKACHKCGAVRCMCEMFAQRQPPGSKSDRTLAAGFGTLEKQFGKNPRYLKTLTETAKAHGYIPRPSDVYIPSEANFQGDPKAFFDSTQLKSQWKAKVKRENRSVTLSNGETLGDRVPQPVKKKRLSESLIRRNMQAYAKQDPNWKKKPRELREMIIERHGAKKR